MATYYVGWDVGAWKCKSTKFSASSQDAIAVLDEKGNLVFAWMGNIYPKYKTKQQVKYKSWADLLNNLSDGNIILGAKDKFKDTDEFIIAIDAVLGVPKAMSSLWKLDDNLSEVDGQKEMLAESTFLSFENITEGELFMFRTTERLLESKPLSVVRDMIGSQSSKALYTLKSMGLSWNKASLHWTGKNVSAFETYPAAASSRLEIKAQQFLKGKEQDMEKYDGFKEYIEVISGNEEKDKDIDALLQNKEKCKELKNQYSDFIDAIICAQVALSHDKLQGPSDANKRSDATEEGWIWLPKAKEVEKKA